MNVESKNPIIRLARWLLYRPSYMLLTAGDEALALQNARRFRFAWLGLLGVSLVWGLGSIGLWGAVWFFSKEPVHRLIQPTIVVAVVNAAWPMRRAFQAVGSLRGNHPSLSLGIIAIVTGVLSACFIWLPMRFFPSEFYIPSN